ncbi:MAG: sigma-70 family RNA polymerase sigma factor [Bacteroidota bacterium]
MTISLHNIVARHLHAEQKGLREKNFGLSAEEFAELLTQLRAGDNRLYERIFLRHFEECRYYLVQYDGATPEQAYDVVMEVMLRFHDMLLAGKVKYGNLRYLFTLMAHQDYARAQKGGIRLRELRPELRELPEEKVGFSEEEYDILYRAFRSLGRNCRKLLETFYYTRRNLKEVAEDEGRSATAVRKQKSRCMARLRQNFHHLS